MCISDWDFKRNLIRGINFKLESISAAATLASKHIAHFKSGQKLASFAKVQFKYLLHSEVHNEVK